MKKNYTELIVKIRQQNDWTQQQLAERLGVSQRAVSYWEEGENAPSKKIMMKLEEIESQIEGCAVASKKNPSDYENMKIAKERAEAKGEAYKDVLYKLLNNAVVVIGTRESEVFKRLEALKESLPSGRG